MNQLKFSKKLKIKKGVNLLNIFIPVALCKEKESKYGWKFFEVTVGDYTIIVDAKFVYPSPKDENVYSIGVKGNFKYGIKDEDAEVTGVDLISYYNGIKEDDDYKAEIEKILKAKVDLDTGEVTKTKTKKEQINEKLEQELTKQIPQK